MHGFEILKYYSRPEIQSAMLSFSKEREVVGSSKDGTFMKRPDILAYPKDITERVKNNVVAFHCSVERWYNPMQLSSNLKQQDIESLRKAFDIIIDIDSKSKLEYARIAAQVVYNFLKDVGINPTIKFSGSRGFHIAIANEAFPETIDFKETSKRYPEIPQALVEYIREKVKDNLLDELIDLEGGVASLVSTAQISELSPYSFVELEKNWSNRHLFRMPYSVDFEEPIVIKKNDEIKILPIGEFIDGFFNREEDFQSRKIRDLDFKTISANLSTNYKTQFSFIEEVIRHKINEDLKLIKLECGREVKVTSGHSLFRLRDGRIEVVKGNEINKGDYLLVPKKLPSYSLVKTNSRITLTDRLISLLSPFEKNFIFLCHFDNKIFKEIYGKKTKEMLKERYKNVYNWKHYNILPLDVYEELKDRSIVSDIHFVNAKIKQLHHGGGTTPLPNELTIDRDLMRLLGYYTSEGSCEIRKNRHRISFSFGIHEKKLIKDCLNILKRKFGLRGKINKNTRSNSLQIQVDSTTLTLIFSRLFSCGRIAKEKRVPNIVWLSDDSLKIEYFRAYLLGDGSKRKDEAKNRAATASKWLRNDLSILSGMLKLNYLLSEDDVDAPLPQGGRGGIFHVYWFLISGVDDVNKLGFQHKSKRQGGKLLDLIPIREAGLEDYVKESRFRYQFDQGKIIRRDGGWILNLVENNKKSENIRKIIKGDIGFLRVVDIKTVKPTTKYVYDLSIKNDENFVSGTGILLHNSLHPKTWLVSLPIKPEELRHFNIENMKPKNIKIHADYLSNREDEATDLLLNALEWKTKQPKPIIAKERVRRSSKVVPEEFFPPCIAQILKGLKDGKKRSLFTLITFFRAVNWDENKIEERIKEWNKNNDPPLSERLVSTQLKWHFRQTRKLQPPNSDLELFYKSIGIEHDSKICGKNPANDAFKLFLRQNVQKKSR